MFFWAQHFLDLNTEVLFFYLLFHETQVKAQKKLKSFERNIMQMSFSVKIMRKQRSHKLFCENMFLSYQFNSMQFNFSE